MYKPVMAEIVDLMQELKPTVSSKIDTPELVIESIEKWFSTNESRIGQSEKLPEISHDEQKSNELATNHAKISHEIDQKIAKQRKTGKSTTDKIKKKSSLSKGLDAFGLTK